MKNYETKLDIIVFKGSLQKQRMFIFETNCVCVDKTVGFL